MKISTVVFSLVLVASAVIARAEPPQGMYFAKKVYQPSPLPKFEAVKDKLPAPIFDENPVWLKMYWKSWELAFRNFHEPAPRSGYVSQFIDAAFSQNIFQWDTCFMTMFCNYAHPLVPGIGSLDNFYCKQYEDGEIAREVDRTTGVCFVAWLNQQRKPLFSAWGWNVGGNNVAVEDRGNVAVQYRGRPAPATPPHLTLDAMDHPLFSWAEMEHCRVTGDKSRIALVYEPLKHYREALNTYLRQGNGLYITDWASMDNSQRNPYLDRGGCGIDISSEMVMFDRDLAAMATMLGKQDESRQFRKDADATAALINKLMWDPQKKFYFDLTLDGRRAAVKTVAGFWPLLAGVPNDEQAKCLVAQLENPKTFARLHRVPTVAADERGFSPNGNYWRGSVWAPTDTMVIRGLERYGYHDLAREIARNHLTNIGKVFEKTGTVWENYAPDKLEPGQPAARDFVGWSGIGPILYLLEYGIGLQPDAPSNRLTWDLISAKRCGCERFRFAGHTVTLTAEPPAAPSPTWRIAAESDGAFRLLVKRGGRHWEFPVNRGANSFSLDY
jgi:hypothetical protein